MLKSGMSPCQGDGPARRQARDDVPLGGTRTARGRGMPAHGAGTGVSRPGRGTGDGPASPGGDAPPIFFLKHQKENAPCTVEKKKCSAQNRRLWRLFCLNAGVVRIHAAETCQAPAGCAVPQRNRERAPRIWYCAAAFRGGHRKGFTISPARSASLRAPPVYPREGNPTGRGRSPAPLCR